MTLSKLYNVATILKEYESTNSTTNITCYVNMIRETKDNSKASLATLCIIRIIVHRPKQRQYLVDHDYFYKNLQM